MTLTLATNLEANYPKRMPSFRSTLVSDQDRTLTRTAADGRLLQSIEGVVVRTITPVGDSRSPATPR